MKKIKTAILSLALVALSVFAYGQYKTMLATAPASAGVNPTGADSVASNGVTAAYLYTPKLYQSGYKSLSFQVYARRVSSAMNGKVLLQGSNDGLNWTALSTADSIHISDGATDVGDKILHVNNVTTTNNNNGIGCLYYRLKFTQIAGDTAYVKAKVFGRQ